MKKSWIWIGAAVVALAFLYLPTLGVSGGQLLGVLLLLLCPLLHLFGMHGHGGHAGHGSGESGSSTTDEIKRSDRET